MDSTSGGMDKMTGKFTAKIAGVYQFNFIGYIFANEKGYVWMTKGDSNIAFFGRSKSDSYATFSGSVITRLDVGQQLYAKAQSGSKFYGGSDRRVLFQGFLLAEL